MQYGLQLFFAEHGTDQIVLPTDLNGPHNRVKKIYERNEQAYRDLYYRLHLEVDGPIDSVRKTVSGNTLNETILFRTSDHGDLLGAHGGLHQKWFTLYDEATRVPFQIVGYLQQS